MRVLVHEFVLRVKCRGKPFSLESILKFNERHSPNYGRSTLLVSKPLPTHVLSDCLGGPFDLKTTVRAAQNLAFKIEPLQCSTKW